MLLIITASVMYSGTIGCRAQTVAFQRGDTVIVFEDRKVLIPLGPDTSCVLLWTVSRDGEPEYLPRCPINTTRERQAGIRLLRFPSEHQQGDALAQAFFDGFEIGSVLSGQKIIEKGESEYGKYIIKSVNDGVEYILWWFTPNRDHLISVHYVLGKANFDELGGMPEMRRFAERVRLLPE